MIVYITTRGHGRTLRSLSRRTFGFPTPRVVLDRYERLLGARRVPKATYIFADLERLAPWELRIAADFFRVLNEAGLRCLNDPARAMSRVELLRSLRAAGINPLMPCAPMSRPRPARFPVFLRFEMDHNTPLPGLLGNQGGNSMRPCSICAPPASPCVALSWLSIVPNLTAMAFGTNGAHFEWVLVCRSITSLWIAIGASSTVSGKS